LACILLLCLFAHTLFGTLFQVQHGLYEAKEVFFNSWFLTTDSGLPMFPGGVTVMGLLTLNLIVGGLWRIKWQSRNTGVLIIHFGIIFMLVAGLVKLTNSEEGQLKLREGQMSDEFLSVSEWQVAIYELGDGNEVPMWVMGDELLTDLHGTKTRTFHADDLPFDLVLSNFLPNCSVLPKGPNWEASGEVIDGFGFFARPLEKEEERNNAGVQAQILASDGQVRRSLLWAPQRGPWTVDLDGRRFAIDLKHTTYPMPFAIRLDDFTREDHPGVDMAKSYRSNVTKIDEDGDQAILIQMNEPLRSGGLVLFQLSYGEDQGGEAYSVFSVTRNPSDKWPEYSLWIITLGLVITFGRHLTGFIRKQNKRRNKASGVSA
ncbi:MAG: cytochrome c biogenesis protein ResB, partial [Planctomycetota bacterium]